MGRTVPVVESGAGHHSPCPIKKARLEKEDLKANLKSNAAQALPPEAALH
jgi:hypothetical protein